MNLYSVVLSAAALTPAWLLPARPLQAQNSALPAPRRLLAAQTSPTEITLTWKGNSSASEYVVFGPKKKTDLGGAVVQLGRISGTGTRYVARVLAAGVEHRFAIQAIGKPGETSKRAKFNVVVPTAGERTGVVSAPGSVQAKLTAPGEITIRWDAVPGATAYSIGRSIHPGGFGRLCELCDPTKTKYVDRDVTPGQIHVYGVATVAPQGRSKTTRSNEVTPTGHSTPEPADAEDPGPPEKPEEVKAVATSPNSIALSWEAGEGATGYEISRRINNGESRILVPTTEKTRYVDNQATVSAKGALSYGVTSLNSNGRSEEVTVFVHGGDTATAQQSKDAIDLKAGLKSSNTVLLTWGGMLSGHTYSISRRVGSGVPAIIATIVGTMTQFVDVLPSGIGGMVGYVIKDLNSKGASNEALLTINRATIDSTKAGSDPAGIAPKAPSNLKATVKSSSVWLTYDVSPGTTFIRILRSIGGGQFVEVGRVPGTVSSFSDTFPAGTLASTLTYAIEALSAVAASQRVSVTIDPAKARVDSAGPKDRTDSAGMGSKGPANPKAVRSLPLQVRVTWDQVAGATGYEIRRAIANGGYELVARVGPFVGLALAFVDALPVNLPIDAQVRYAISALSPKGRSLETVAIASPFHTEEIDSAKGWSERTPSSTPGDLKATVESPNTIALTWSPQPGALSYEIRRSINNGGYQVMATVGGGAMRFVDQLPLSQFADQVIRYTIRALNPKGAASPEWTSNPITPDKGAAETSTSRGRPQDADSIRPPRGRSQN